MKVLDAYWFNTIWGPVWVEVTDTKGEMLLGSPVPEAGGQEAGQVPDG